MPDNSEGTWRDVHKFYYHTICEQAKLSKPECCSSEDIILECSPGQLDLTVPKCFLDDQNVDAALSFIGTESDNAQCQG